MFTRGGPADTAAADLWQVYTSARWGVSRKRGPTVLVASSSTFGCDLSTRVFCPCPTFLVVTCVHSNMVDFRWCTVEFTPVGPSESDECYFRI